MRFPQKLSDTICILHSVGNKQSRGCLVRHLPGHRVPWDSREGAEGCPPPSQACPSLEGEEGAVGDTQRQAQLKSGDISPDALCNETYICERAWV